MKFGTLLFLLWLSAQQTAIPFKPFEEFKLALEYSFKQRTTGASSTTTGNDATIVVNESTRDYNRRTGLSGPLPYLVVNLSLLRINEGEAKIRSVDGSGKVVLNKKIAADKVYKIDLGYTDDMKDRVTPHEYNIYILSADKKEVSRIHLFVKENGEFYVNDEMRGKF
jgi:hypothetical protein